jgi:hypothetical protein
MKQLHHGDDRSSLSDRELADLITRHFDGGLDLSAQRRLAALLAGSASARETLGRYLRLEAALIRVGAAAMLDGTQPQRSVIPWRRHRWKMSRGRRLAAGAVITSGLVAAVVACVFVVRSDNDPHGDSGVDVVAVHWLRLRDDEAARQEGSPVAAELAADDEPQTAPEQPEQEPDDLQSWMPGAPPAWLVAAVAEQGMRRATPDEG